MDKAKQASIELAVAWESPHAAHTDWYFFDKIDFWRDLLPGELGGALAELTEGESAADRFEAGALVSPYDERQARAIKDVQFTRRLPSGAVIEPRTGRFYPSGLLSQAADVFPGDQHPFRYLGQENSTCHVDLNHPLARVPVAVEARVVEVLDAREERGGRCNDVAQALTENGPGLQASLPDRDTDFFSGTPFARLDERGDAVFYETPRLVNHIEEVAMGRIRGLYARFIQPGMRVLDLMCSWNSHLPSDITGLSVTGLGMNRAELQRNERLTEYVVHDLNAAPQLPFGDDAFDVAICTVSVEYLTRPIDVFREAARVLRPGAPFIVTFSDRWFPPKVIQLWTELHAFERMGLVIDYFRKSGGFGELQTESVRGLLRPADDKYAGMTPLSDPVYAVWGYAKHR